MVRELFVIGGPSGAGKTSISKVISSLKNYPHISFFREMMDRGKKRGLSKKAILKVWCKLINEKIKTTHTSEVWDTHFSFQKKAPPAVAFAKRDYTIYHAFGKTYCFSNIRNLLEQFERIWIVIILSSLKTRLKRMQKTPSLYNNLRFALESLAEIQQFLILLDSLYRLNKDGQAEVLVNVTVNEGGEIDAFANAVISNSLPLSHSHELFLL